MDTEATYGSLDDLDDPAPVKTEAKPVEKGPALSKANDSEKSTSEIGVAAQAPKKRGISSFILHSFLCDDFFCHLETTQTMMFLESSIALTLLPLKYVSILSHSHFWMCAETLFASPEEEDKVIRQLTESFLDNFHAPLEQISDKMAELQ